MNIKTILTMIIMKNANDIQNRKLFLYFILYYRKKNHV